MSQHAKDMPHAGDRPRRVSIENAARMLRISENAVRKRVERGTLASERDGDTRYVLLDVDMPQHAKGMSYDMPSDLALMQAHLDSLAGQIAFLRMELEARTEEARRKDHIIMQMAQRIPQLEAPRDEPRAPESAGEESGDTEPPEAAAAPETGAERRSWWRRFLGR